MRQAERRRRYRMTSPGYSGKRGVIYFESAGQPRGLALPEK